MNKIIQPHWNKLVRNDWPTKPREHMRESDIVRTYIDRYYSMKGVEPTNPFPDRVLRIFDAGKVIEFIIRRALTLAGLLNKKEEWCEYPAGENNLRIVGRLDATIGGFVDWEHATELMLDHLAEYKLDLDDDLIAKRAFSIIEGLKDQYPKGFNEEMLVEIKSINSLSFWAHKNRDEEGNFLGYPHNRLQLYTYLKMTGLRQGILLYLSKDDFTMEEIYVLNGDPVLEEQFQNDITTMTRYMREDEVPPKLPEIVYNSRKGAFEENWEVERSLYLTHIYGYPDKESFYVANHQTVLDVNRALRHLRKDKVKPEDLEVIEEWNLFERVNDIDSEE